MRTPMSRALRALGIALLLVLPASEAWAQDRPPTVRELADQVVRAVDTGETDTIVEAIRAARQDVWIVADDLCAQERFDAASALTALVPETISGGLAEYVEGQRSNAVAPAIRTMLRDAYAAMAGGDSAAAARALSGLRPEPGTDVPTARALPKRRSGRGRPVRSSSPATTRSLPDPGSRLRASGQNLPGPGNRADTSSRSELRDSARSSGIPRTGRAGTRHLWPHQPEYGPAVQRRADSILSLLSPTPPPQEQEEHSDQARNDTRCRVYCSQGS